MCGMPFVGFRRYGIIPPPGSYKPLVINNLREFYRKTTIEAHLRIGVVCLFCFRAFIISFQKNH